MYAPKRIPTSTNRTFGRTVKIGAQNRMTCRLCGSKVVADVTSEISGTIHTIRYDMYVLFYWSEVRPLHFSPQHGQDFYCRTRQHGFDRSQIVTCRNSSKKYWYGHGIVMKTQPGQSPKLKEALYCDGIARPSSELATRHCPNRSCEYGAAYSPLFESSARVIVEFALVVESPSSINVI